MIKAHLLLLLFFTLPCDVISEKKPRKLREKGKSPVLLYKILSVGIGSNLINMIGHKRYYEEQGYTFKVAETKTRYKYKDKGILIAFFSPKFEILDNEDLVQMQLSKAETDFVHDFSRRRGIQNEVGGWMGEKPYDYLRKEACTTLVFNEEAKKDINMYKRLNKIPDYSRFHTVAFHVRRGDKTIGESKKYEAKEYVDKLLSLDLPNPRPIKYCFLASDDVEAIKEMKQAIRQSSLTCEVHDLVKREQHGNKANMKLSDDNMMQFATELSVMSQATYFVGTFSSNVGDLVALMRSCSTSDEEHYYRSYGVDTDRFWWR